MGRSALPHATAVTAAWRHVLRYFIDLPLPVEAVERALLAAPATWLPRLADRAGGRGEQLLTEVGALGVHRTQLALNAGYRPPLGTVGRAIDRALLHRVAEATVKDFLDQVGLAVQRVTDRQRRARCQAPGGVVWRAR